MINYLSESIADFYIKKNIILPNEKEVYKFGISLILNDIVTFSLILIASALFAKFHYGIEFLLTFCLARIFTGGYHAREVWICRGTTLFVAFIVLFASRMLAGISICVLISIMVVSSIVAIPFSPVKHPNKELTPELIKRGKIGTVIMFLLFSSFSVFAFLYINVTDALIIALSLSAVSVLVIIGKFTNERSETE